MRVTIAERPEELEELEEEWWQLLERGPADPVFGSPVWARQWWLHLAEKDDRLCLARLKDSGELAGLAPLYLTKEAWGPFQARVLRILGQSAADYSDLLWPARLEEMKLLLQALLERQDWDVLSLSRLPGHSPTRPAISQAALALGLESLEEDEEVCPFFGLEGSFEDYFTRRFQRPSRKRIRRMSRHLAERGQHRFELWQSGEGLEEILEKLAGLEARAWQGRRGVGLFSQPKRRGFFFSIARFLAERGELAIHLQWLDDKLMDYHFGFIAQARYYDFSVAFDPDFAEYSPGVLSLVDLVSRCFELGIKRFDLMRGGEPYKASWTDQASQNVNLYLFAPRPRARLLKTWLSSRLKLRRLKGRLKRTDPHQGFRIMAGEAA